MPDDKPTSPEPFNAGHVPDPQEQPDQSQRLVLTVDYSAGPITVDHARIPSLEGVRAPQYEEVETGEGLYELFREATAKAALVIPAGLEVELYVHDEGDDEGFYLMAYASGNPDTKITTGWHDVDNVEADAGQRGDEPAAIAHALEFIAGEINVSLGPSNHREPS